MKTHFVVQTRRGAKYTELFRLAFQAGEFTALDVAVAYATISGTRLLERTVTGLAGPKQWEAMGKRWLVGIDWCRTDPPALKRLAGLRKSEVRVVNGEDLIRRKGCVPQETYHPKLFLLSGPRTVAVICGSGNLSANGLGGGCECGSLWLAPSGGNPDSWPGEVVGLREWFKTAWNNGSRLPAVLGGYEAICRTRIRKDKIVPTEDDVVISEWRGRGLSEAQLRQARSFDNLWIEAGILGANLGAEHPGNQLDMKRGTRAFFGATVEEVQPNDIIDHVTIVWGSETYRERTLKYGHNGMDKLNVPPVGDRGRDFYKDKTLLFTRLSNGAFRFEVGDSNNLRDWRKTSRTKGVLHKVGRREWGLF